MAKKSKSKTGDDEEGSSSFNPYTHLDDTLDSIEKDFSLSGSGLSRDERRMNTVSLAIDLVLGGGITAGGWYTFVGGEQSSKSTLANSTMAMAVNSSIPIVSMWDYEGCFSDDTVLKTNYGALGFSDLLALLRLDPSSFKPGEFRPVEGLEVETLGQMVKVDSVYFSGSKPMTKVSTASKSLEGFAHPMLCLDLNGNLVYRNLEDLKIGDRVVTV